MAGGYDIAAVTYFAAMSSQPDGTRKRLLNELIVGLKTDGVWPLLDWLSIMAAHDAQAARINAKNPAQVATEAVAPTFTTDRGYTGNGSTQYLDTGVNPSTAGGLFSQNSAHMGVWTGTNVTNGLEFDVGNARSRINPRSGGNFVCGGNASSGDTSALPVATSIGHTAWYRNNSADFRTFKNGAFVETETRTSEALTNANVRICDTDGSTFSTRRIQAVHWGGAPSDANVLAIYNRLNTYMTAVGAV